MIRIHLGVHKTATTYLQNLFELNRARIAAAGSAYWPVMHIRPALAYSLWSEAMGDGPLGPLRRRALRGAPFNHLNLFLEAGDSQVLSDENIPGSAAESLHGRIYPQAADRMGRLAAILGERPVEVWLCLRAYPQFLASLYAEALRHGAFMPLAEMVGRNREPAGQWPMLVEAIHRALPRARIVIWRYEQFAALETQVVERLSGVPLAQMQPLPGGNVRTSPSARAIAQHLEAAEPMARARRILSLVMAEAQLPASGSTDSFDPWPAEQSARMQAAYEADMAAIAALPFVEMLTP